MVHALGKLKGRPEHIHVQRTLLSHVAWIVRLLIEMVKDSYSQGARIGGTIIGLLGSSNLLERTWE